jgi:hypothetical protein
MPTPRVFKLKSLGRVFILLKHGRRDRHREKTEAEAKLGAGNRERLRSGGVRGHTVTIGIRNTMVVDYRLDGEELGR